MLADPHNRSNWKVSDFDRLNLRLSIGQAQYPDGSLQSSLNLAIKRWLLSSIEIQLIVFI